MASKLQKMTVKETRARKSRNVISGLVANGVKMNFNKASDFTQEQAERARRKKFSGAGRG